MENFQERREKVIFNANWDRERGKLRRNSLVLSIQDRWCKMSEKCIAYLTSISFFLDAVQFWQEKTYKNSQHRWICHCKYQGCGFHIPTIILVCWCRSLRIGKISPHLLFRVHTQRNCTSFVCATEPPNSSALQTNEWRGEVFPHSNCCCCCHWIFPFFLHCSCVGPSFLLSLSHFSLSLFGVCNVQASTAVHFSLPLCIFLSHIYFHFDSAIIDFSYSRNFLHLEFHTLHMKFYKVSKHVNMERAKRRNSVKVFAQNKLLHSRSHS